MQVFLSLLNLSVAVDQCARDGPRNLIITYGPPASGKSGAYEMWKTFMRPDGCRARKLDINVDDLVAANPQYQLVAKDLAQDVDPRLRSLVYREACYVDQPEEWCRPLFEAEMEFCKKGWANYSNFRQQANMQSNSMLLEQALIKGKINDNEIQDVVYEVTGSNESYSWMLSVAKLAKASGMKVHLVYPVVSVNNLRKRALSRAVGTADEPGTGYLPCGWFLEDVYEEAARNFTILLDDNEAHVHFDAISVFDNDSTEAKPLLHYDRDSFREDIQYDNACSIMQSLTDEGKWPQVCQHIQPE